MPSQRPPPQTRPRMTPYRYAVRLHDRLELLLARFVDGDPHARAGFAAYKADRDGRWAQEDGGKKEDGSIPVMPTPVTGSETVKAPARRRCLQKRRDIPPPLETQAAAKSETTRDGGKDKGTEVFPGFDFGLGGEGPGARDTAGTDDRNYSLAVDGNNGPTVERRHTEKPRPRNVSGSSTFSSVVESTLSEARRRKRKRSDARPGYFDPDPFGDRADATGDGAGEGDELVMNIPVELEKRP